MSPVITDTLNACMPFVQDFVGMGDTLKKVMPMVTELAAGILPLLAQLVACSCRRLCSTSHSSYSRCSCRSSSLFYRRSPASLPPCSPMLTPDHLDRAACAGGA